MGRKNHRRVVWREIFEEAGRNGMVESKQLLPLGSIVLLEEGLQKLIIVGRGAIYRDQVTQEEVFADYMGAIYPIGVNPETTIFFQNENIDRVIFRGFSDEEEERFMEVYGKWEQELTISKKRPE